MNNRIATPLLERTFALGEGVLWHPVEKRLYWVNIPSGELFAYDESSREAECRLKLSKAIGGFTFQKSGSFLLFLEKGEVVEWFPQTGEFKTILEASPFLVEDRFNDVAAAPDGSVFCGTMPNSDGFSRLFHLKTDGELTVVGEKFRLSNGMGFSPDEKWFYFADTRDFALWVYDYRKGEVANPKKLIDFHDRPGRPDGLTVDKNGNIWVAETGAEQVAVFNPAGEALFTIKTEGALKPTSAAFGAAGLSRLYITSLVATEQSVTPENRDGSLFFCEIEGFGGKEEYLSDVSG